MTLRDTIRSAFASDGPAGDRATGRWFVAIAAAALVLAVVLRGQRGVLLSVAAAAVFGFVLVTVLPPTTAERRVHRSTVAAQYGLVRELADAFALRFDPDTGTYLPPGPPDERADADGYSWGGVRLWLPAREAADDEAVGDFPVGVGGIVVLDGERRGLAVPAAADDLARAFEVSLFAGLAADGEELAEQLADGLSRWGEFATAVTVLDSSTDGDARTLRFAVDGVSVVEDEAVSWWFLCSVVGCLVARATNAPVTVTRDELTATGSTVTCHLDER